MRGWIVHNEADSAQISAEADAIFDSIDVNGDGRISREELGQHLTGQGYTTQAVDRIFEKIDANSDGVISRQE